ncbi:phosphoglycolate phosphatase [Ideonella sp. 4Y11]|uniref:phosphoglycolate phosphatase n=1 Tax=Ideonella aquatica TaxID=2824119 RepID=A0A940YNP9_9BURK|nr:phosphoglycolate phosphatase [Ideonella aquatica]MBQ0961236.1 phosphoglycolate phosphatase [Ideonella aquatica]
MSSGVQVVLFDLDGTLVDSAPDLAGAANELRARHQQPAMPFDALRPMVGAGARGMLGVAFGVAPGDPDFEPLREAFLSLYEARMLRETRVFAAMDPVLQRLEAAGLRWGIVTNKHERFAWPVIQGLGLDRRASALVAGDTTPHAKPHPAPLLEAARQAGVAPEACIYVGDDLRDIQAGRAAGMAALAAAWGYLGQGESIDDWAADAVLRVPADLLNWLNLA